MAVLQLLVWRAPEGFMFVHGCLLKHCSRDALAHHLPDSPQLLLQASAQADPFREQLQDPAAAFKPAYQAGGPDGPRQREPLSPSTLPGPPPRRLNPAALHYTGHTERVTSTGLRHAALQHPLGSISPVSPVSPAPGKAVIGKVESRERGPVGKPGAAGPANEATPSSVSLKKARIVGACNASQAASMVGVGQTAELSHEADEPHKGDWDVPGARPGPKPILRDMLGTCNGHRGVGGSSPGVSPVSSDEDEGLCDVSSSSSDDNEPGEVQM
jgi:hypothetical protein